jgi:hypothetical protein
LKNEPNGHEERNEYNMSKRGCDRRDFLKRAGLGAAGIALSGCAGGAGSFSAGPSKRRPNILWILAEDMSPHWSCYGEATIRTPSIDRLAAEGALFRNAFVTSPVCSPSRSAMITGMYQTTIGAHHHRSSWRGSEIHLPEQIRLLVFQTARLLHCKRRTKKEGLSYKSCVERKEARQDRL